MCQLELIGAFWTHVGYFSTLGMPCGSYSLSIVAIVGILEGNPEACEVSISGNEKWLPFAWVLGVKKRLSG
jgi:hypothetical protein